MKEMTLKEAKRIAGRVGARIVETPNKGIYEIRIAGRPFENNRINHSVVFHEQSLREAAKTAVLETGKHAKALYERAKQVYVEEDIL